MNPLLEVRGLSKTYRRGLRGRVQALRDVSFTLPRGICLGLVGESGCGKSTLCRMITGLERPSAGSVLYEGEPPAIGQSRIQMVFQNSLDAVDLHIDAYHIISEPLENFFHMRGPACREEVARLLRSVGLSPEDMSKYPLQFSGGQLQRVCIARALAAKPELLLLDEPLSSLDVSVQAQILDLLAGLKQALGSTYILISHDLEAVYYLSDAMLVMYGGSIVEQIDRIEDFRDLRHPYTRRLLAAHDLDRTDGETPPAPEKGAVEGCPYFSLCPQRRGQCRDCCPPLTERETGHRIACWSV